MKYFQAKDIQRLLEVPKYRYEYIASRIGVRPDIREVEGMGRTHLYSYKNLIQFAVVEKINSLGIAPKTCRALLAWLNKIEDRDKIEIFDHKGSSLRVHYVDAGKKRFFALTGHQGKLLQNSSGEKYISFLGWEFLASTEHGDPVETLDLEALQDMSVGMVSVNILRIIEIINDRL